MLWDIIVPYLSKKFITFYGILNIVVMSITACSWSASWASSISILASWIESMTHCLFLYDCTQYKLHYVTLFVHLTFYLYILNTSTGWCIMYLETNWTRMVVAHSKANPLNPKLADSMLPATQRYVVCGDIRNEKNSLTASLESRDTTPKQFWKIKSCLFMENYITLTIHFVQIR